MRAAKSAFKDGKADCHDQFVNWSRNDRFCKGYGERGVEDAAPYGRIQGVRWDGTMWGAN